jgi:hypothetical protein
VKATQRKVQTITRPGNQSSGISLKIDSQGAGKNKTKTITILFYTIIIK